MPQFAVNSQLATRNPKPAVLLSPQGRVKLSCGLSVERCAFKTAFNLPSTHNPQPSTLNLPFIVPSRSGRNALEIAALFALLTSPSPQGRVGTNLKALFYDDFELVAVPSRSGQIELRVVR